MDSKPSLVTFDPNKPPTPEYGWKMVGFQIVPSEMSETNSLFYWVRDEKSERVPLVRAGAPQDLWIEHFEFLDIPSDENPNDGTPERDWMPVFISECQVHSDLGPNREDEKATEQHVVWARRR